MRNVLLLHILLIISNKNITSCFVTKIKKIKYITDSVHSDGKSILFGVSYTQTV